MDLKFKAKWLYIKKNEKKTNYVYIIHIYIYVTDFHLFTRYDYNIPTLVQILLTMTTIYTIHSHS